MARRMQKVKTGGTRSLAAPVSRGLVWSCVASGVLILLSTFAVIHSTHTCRTLYARLQLLESAQWYLQEDYGRLLLEQSTWASHHRVEKVARNELGMDSPDLAHFRLVAQ